MPNKINFNLLLNLKSLKQRHHFINSNCHHCHFHYCKIIKRQSGLRKYPKLLMGFWGLTIFAVSDKNLCEYVCIYIHPI